MRYLKASLILSLLFIVACGAEPDPVLVDTEANAEAAPVSEVTTIDSSPTEPAPALVTETETQTEATVAPEPIAETESDVASISAPVPSSGELIIQTIQANNDCPTDAFIDVSTYVQNQAYPSPY